MRSDWQTGLKMSEFVPQSPGPYEENIMRDTRRSRCTQVLGNDKGGYVEAAG